jgi:hypothetical protein
MKLLLASRTHGDLERIRDVLESAGIQCLIRGEMLTGLAGDAPPPDCIPEIWVMDDAQLDEARQILASLLSEPVSTGPAWKCPRCGESLEPQFDSCWRCGSPRDEKV